MQVGSWQVDFLGDGDFALDGGAMFGVVPRTIWERSNPPDPRNRIDMALRSLVLRGHGRVVVVDVGVGDKLDEKARSIYRVERATRQLAHELAALGLAPGDVTDVILTHLHFDHAGGATVREGDSLRLQFPRARHYLQAQQLAWARKPSVKDRASYMPENFEPLAESGRLELLDGPEPILPDLELVPVHGHTPALQAVLVHGDPPLFFPSDLVPMASHVRLPFVMGYDNQPLVTLEEKQVWLGRAADEGWRVVFQHDPHLGGATIRRGSRDFELGERFL